MGKAKLILGLAILGLAAVAGWQIASCELANIELQAEMRDIAAQGGSRIGLEALHSGEDLRNAVVQKAKEHDIQIEPAQVTVQRTGADKSWTISLAADYNARVNLFLYSFSLNFTPSSSR